MPSAIFKFPKGFSWGTATSSHQVEGDNTNNTWSRWENEGHTIHKSGRASGWWEGRWQEDFDRAAQSGQTSHRLSLEWSRIQPSPDRWDEQALVTYRLMLLGLLERNIKPMVTLHHFTDPLWLAEMGGWENPQTVAHFEKFVEKVMSKLKDVCSLWCTINEPNVYFVEGFIRRRFPPGVTDLRRGLSALANMIKAHAAAYHAIHRLQPEAQVGYALHFRPMEAARWYSPLDQLIRNIRFSIVNLGFPSAISTGRMKTPLGSMSIPSARGTQDYFGLNYYTMDTVVFDIHLKDELFHRSYYSTDVDVAEGGMNANRPEGFFSAIRWVVKTYPGLPILVTENGIEDNNDSMRPRYMAQHVHAMWRAINFNWPVKGYYWWTLVDNFEWERGWTQRFGLWEMDPDTLERTMRPSVALYAAICKENSLSSAMVKEYCPEVFAKIFPV